MKPRDPVDDALVEELQKSLEGVDPISIMLFRVHVERAVAIVEALVASAPALGTTSDVILSAMGEAFARQAARINDDDKREQSVQTYCAVIRRRVELLVEKRRAAELEQAQREAKDATKH